MNDSENGLLTLLETVTETADTKSFFFKIPENGKTDFKPGQFINIGVPVDGQTHYRSYSISSLPQGNLIQLTIKRVKGGKVSNWMIDQLAIGDRISQHGISGHFNIIDCPFRENVLFISAGCGITPVMSMARHLLSLNDTRIKSIQFIHCARDENNIIYFNELRKLAEELEKFQPTFYLSQPKGEPDRLIRKGRLNSDSLKELLNGHFNDTSVYLCGPDEFMGMVKTEIAATGFDMTHFYMESFTAADTEPAVNAPIQNEAKTHTVSIPDFALTTEVQDGKTLLEVFEENGIPVIAACRSGICGSCKCKVETGKIQLTVDAVANGSLTQKEVEEGYTLACSSRIIDDISISLT